MGSIDRVIPPLAYVGHRIVLTVEGTGFGTAFGAPTITLGSHTIPTAVLTPADAPAEFIRVELSAAQLTGVPAVVPFAIVPAVASGLPAVAGTLQVSSALPTAEQLLSAFDHGVGEHIVCDTTISRGIVLALLQQAASEPATRDALKDQLETSAELLSDRLREQLTAQGDVAGELLGAVGGSSGHAERLEQAVKGGRKAIEDVSKMIVAWFKKASDY